jgi:hypothetical protein
MHGSVIFHSPGDLQASAAVSGWWSRPLPTVVIESGAAGGFGNDVHGACKQFVWWCLSQSPQLGSFDILSLPGLPWSGSDHDPWDWYERLMADVAKWEPPPVLVDLDDFLITHRDEILWPPPEHRRERRTDRRSRSADSPFPAGWFGQSLTYNCYPPEELPPLRVPLAGTFEWLRASPEHDRSIAPDPERTAAALCRLTTSNPDRLPPEFVYFFRSPDLWRRVQSCTGCFLDLDSAAVGIRGGLGSLIRFLSDSQGCKHWHLYLSPCGKRHSVVATYFYTGSECAHLTGGLPHPKDITLCSNSFEEFVYRFWLENEVWFALHGMGSMPEGGEEYLNYYRPNSQED